MFRCSVNKFILPTNVFYLAHFQLGGTIACTLFREEVLENRRFGFASKEQEEQARWALKDFTGHLIGPNFLAFFSFVWRPWL